MSDEHANSETQWADGYPHLVLMRDLDQRETFEGWPETKAQRKGAWSMVTLGV